jgi:hypothetical protein
MCLDRLQQVLLYVMYNQVPRPDGQVLPPLSQLCFKLVKLELLSHTHFLRGI